MIDETVRTTCEGSTFTAQTAAVLVCDRVRPSHDGKRPLLLAVCAAGGAARAVAACVRRSGELEVPGSSGPGKYELLKTAGYEVSAQHVQNGSATILQWHLPDLFALDPGAREVDGDGGDGDGTAESPPFVVMPSASDLTRERSALGDERAEEVTSWLLERTAVLSGDLAHVAGGGEPFPRSSEARFDPTHEHHAGAYPGQVAAREQVALTRGDLRNAVAWAPLVAAYVDRRTVVPSLRDLRFQALLLVTLIELGSASWPRDTSGRYYAWGVGDGWSWSTDRGGSRAEGLESLGWASPFVCAPRGPGLLEQVAVECVRGYEAALRGGRREHARAVIASREEYRIKCEKSRDAALKKSGKRRNGR